MKPSSGPARAIAPAGALLLAALLASAFLWPRAAWLFVAARDRPAVEHALAWAAATSSDGTAEDIRWMARPVVVRAPGRVCVLILMWRAQPLHGKGGYEVCRDSRTGEIVEERAWL